MYKLCSLLLLLTSLYVHATSCIGPITVCSSFDAHSIVFRGRVLGIITEQAAATRVIYPDGSSAMTYSGPMSESVRFEVLEVFKGNPGREISVVGGPGEFQQGQEYIIFATPNETTRTVRTSVCSGNRLLTKPEQDSDLAWLRAYPTAPPTAVIFGNVRMGSGVGDTPAISITLAGQDSQTTSSGEGNKYSFRDLAPGTYTLTAKVPAGFVTLESPSKTLSVAAKGCAQMDWSIASDTHIKGTVTDSSGKRLSHIMVELLKPTANRIGFTNISLQKTDEDGNYDFAKTPPGDYWVALFALGPNNLEAHAPVFYPFGSTSSEAKLLHLSASSTLADVNLVVPEALHRIAIHTHVVNQDGTPVIQAHIAAMDPLTPTQFIGTTADESGNADIALYEGREYSLIASNSGYREPACAGPVRFIAKEGMQLNTLTLDKTWNECRALQKPK
jgi:hypothetical protein